MEVKISNKIIKYRSHRESKFLIKYVLYDRKIIKKKK